jgi:hypothetical protein
MAQLFNNNLLFLPFLFDFFFLNHICITLLSMHQVPGTGPPSAAVPSSSTNTTTSGGPTPSMSSTSAAGPPSGGSSASSGACRPAKGTPAGKACWWINRGRRSYGVSGQLQQTSAAPSGGSLNNQARRYHNSLVSSLICTVPSVLQQ